MIPINYNQLPVFLSVYKNLNMTGAAQDLNLTQSGVSQHIKNLEDEIGKKLFDRYKQKLIPTDDGHTFYNTVSKALDHIHSSFWDISHTEKSIQGKVRIGMPIEFGNAMILPLISEILKTYPKILFEFELGYASTMDKMLIQGELDFAFIDNYKMNKSIETIKVHEEYLELCIHKDLIKNKKLTKKELSTISYIDYNRDNLVLKSWFNHHYNSTIQLNCVTHIMDVQGIAKLIKLKVGAGILPRYVLNSINKNKNIIAIEGSGKTQTNPIFLASLKNKTESNTVKKVKEFLKEKLIEIMDTKHSGL